MTVTLWFSRKETVCMSTVMSADSIASIATKPRVTPIHLRRPPSSSPQAITSSRIDTLSTPAICAVVKRLITVCRDWARFITLSFLRLGLSLASVL